MPSATVWSGPSRGGTGTAGPAAALDDPEAIRHAGPDLLSLALIDSRNRLLHRLARDESAAALRLALRAGVFQEYWIARHVQRQRGEACDPQGPRLAGIEPGVDAWVAGAAPPPSPQAVRDYLAATLDITLELLAGLGAPQTDAELTFYRLSLLHEDRLGEALAERLDLRGPQPGQRPAEPGGPPARVPRPALVVPAQRGMMGAERGAADAPTGLVPHNERWAHEVVVPEFEIDAQAVSWSQVAEFVADGGYDRPDLWSEAGWSWVRARSRRAPRQVEQFRGGVLLRRQGSLVRAPDNQAATHLSRFEAEAWCRWAGRRLPTEAEWELAARGAAARGFVRGDVFEWVLGSARSWPGAGPVGPGGLDAPPAAGTQAVLRGASFATPARRGQASARRFADPGRDTILSGFRSCAA